MPPPGAGHVFLYSTSCPNCSRFEQALRESPANEHVRRVDVDQVAEHQLPHGLEFVPAVVGPDGGYVTGTDAFKWLHEMGVDRDVGGFESDLKGLAFSGVDDAHGYASYTTVFSEIPPEWQSS